MNGKNAITILFLLLMITNSFGQSYLDCVPDILDIQVDGQLVDFGSSIDVELNSLDETFQVRLRGKNTGTDNNPAPYNNLTMSFVQFNSSSDKDRISFTSYTSSDLDESIYFGSEAGGGDQYADYVMYEAVDNDSWQAGELNATYINIKPKNWGEFVIKFRMGLGTDESYSNFNYDPSGGYIGNDDPNGNGDCLGFESYKITVNVKQTPQTGDFDVEVKNIEGGDTNYPGDNGRVQLYDNDGAWVATEYTDANGHAFFSNVEEGSDYFYKVYHTPDDPNNIFGEEYWGKKENVVIYGNTTNYSEFIRNMPYGQDIKVYKNGEEVTGQTVSAGSELEFRITVTNPNVNNYYARTRLVLDRNKLESYDYDNTTSGQIVYGNNGEKTFIFYVTLNDEGDYYRAFSTQTDVDGGYRNTDGWVWSEQPIIKIEKQYGDLTVEVKNIDGSSTPYPADNGKVQLYDSKGALIATDYTDANGNAYFPNLEAGSGYYYKVYHTPDDANNIFGEEYWGKNENVTIYGNTTNYSEFTRNMPYGQNIKVYNNGEDVTGQTVSAGTELEFRITVINPNQNDYYAKTRLVLDRNKSESYDYDETSSGLIVYGNNGERTYIFNVTLNEVGDYYRAISTQTDVDGGYRNTDGWTWSEQPIINIAIKINNPKGGEKWAVGTKQDITWESEGIDAFLIEYSVDDGTSWTTIQSNVEASSGKYEWEEIPNTPSENCYIKLTDSENSDVYSISNKFSIVELNVNENELVTRDKNKLKYQDKYMTYVGVNLYFMQDLIAQGKEYIVQDLLDICEQRGINIIRTWAFNDDPDKQSVIQNDPEKELNEENFNALKRVVELAEQRGFKLIMPLVNHWKDYGGMQQYVIWYNQKFNTNLDTSAQKYEYYFYTNETIKNWYKSYITKIVTEFRESDAIMAWELANEPRESNWSAPAPTDTAEFKKWIEEMSSYIRESLDPNHLIGLGSEGNFSDNKEDERYFKDIHNRKNIDFTSLHLYTESEKLNLNSLDEMEKYFSKRKEMSDELNKPFLIEEFGFKREINGDPQTRINYYNGIYQRFDNQDVNGSNFWLLLHNDLPEDVWDKETYGIYENRDSEILDAVEKAAKSRNDINVEITSIGLVDFPPDGLQIIGYVEDKNQNRKPNYTIGAEDPVDLVSTSSWATTDGNGEFNYISTNSAKTNNYIYKFFSQDGEPVDKVLSVSVETTSDYGGNELIADIWITVKEVIFDIGEAVDLNNDTKTFSDKVNLSSIPPEESEAHKSLEIAGNYLIKSIGNTLVDYASNPFNIVASIGVLTCLVPDLTITKSTCAASVKAVNSGISVSAAKSFAKTAIDMSDLEQEKKDKYKAIVDYSVAGISLAKMSPDYNILENAQTLGDVNNVIYTNLYSVDQNSTKTSAVFSSLSSEEEDDDALYMVVIDSEDNYVLIEIRDNSELTAHLSDGACNPSSGTIDDEYTFTVRYIDPNNNPPDNPIELVIDGGTKYSMAPQGSNWSEGVEYIYVNNSGTFSEGEHTYYFQGTQGDTKLRDPLTGEYSFSVDDPNTLDITLTLDPNPTDINTPVTCTATTSPVKVNYPIDFDQDENLGEFEDSNPIYTNENGAAVVIYHPNKAGTTSIFALDGNDHNNYDSKSLTIDVQQNTAPTLAFTNENGYETDGVNPDEGKENSTFEFRIKYTDADGDEPDSGNPVVHIFNNSAEISGSPFVMSAVNSNPVTDGRIYTYSTSNLTASNNYSYRFEAQDANGTTAEGEGTSTMNGPVVTENVSSGDSLAAYWNFNDGNVSTATDISGNGNTGTIYNATLTTGYDDALDQAFYFDSDNDTIVIDIQESLSSINQGDYTVSMWIKFDEIPANNRFALDMGDVDQFGFRFLENSKPTYKWNLSSGNVTLTADTALQTGSWAHIVSVLEGNRGKIYVNGKKFIDSVAITSYPSELISKFAIGNICGGGQAPTYFPGSIDEVKIFNKALSDFEVLKLFNSENIAPTLTFTDEPGYETDGVNPNEGEEGSTFEFRIKYSDADGDEPGSGYPVVHIFDNGQEISGSPFSMTAVNSDPVTNGRIYVYSTSNLTASDNYTYRFEALDANDAMAEGEGTNTLNGPVVTDSTSGEPIGITMYKIDGGTFIMGNDDGPSDEQPEHEVTLSTFQLSKYEITNRQFVEVYNWALEQGKISVNSTTVENTEGERQELIDLDAEGCYISYNGTKLVVEDGRYDQPVCEVTWYGAVAFSNYYSEKNGLTPVYDLNAWSCNWEGNGYRLPTEAEWEYASGGGNQSHDYEYSGSNNVDEVGWYLDNSGSQPHDIGTKNPNELGLYDMSGNNQEWCWDYFGNYSIDPQTDPVGPSSQEDERRILRGGSWSSTADILRVTNREHISANLSNGDTGFRIAKKYLGEPTLSWTGEAGYEFDGVNPDTLVEYETATFRVKYIDLEGDAPAEGYPKLYIFKNGNSINGSPFVMAQANSESFASGRIYSFNIDSLEESNDYSYRFEAKDVNENFAIGEATQENEGPVIEKAIPGAPQLVFPANNSINVDLTLILDWSDVDNAETYQLQVADTSDFSHIIINQQGIDTSQYRIEEDILAYGTKYFWRTNAQNSSGTSSWSEEWNFTTKNAPELSVSPESWEAPPAGGSSSDFSVTNIGNNDSLTFTVTTEYDWLSLNVSDSVTPGSFTIIAAENNSGEVREGNVVVKAISDDVKNSPFTVYVSQAPVPEDIKWQTVLTVSDNNANQTDLTFGTATNATDDYDADYDQYAPPKPPSGSFYSYFTVSNENYVKDFRAPIKLQENEEIIWTVEFQYSSGGAPVTLEWNCETLSDSGSFLLVDNPDEPVQVKIDMRSDSSYTVSDIEIDKLYIVYRNSISFEMAILKDWNMIGLPLEVSDSYYKTLFPNAIENTLYSWRGYYQLEDSLEKGIGYWLRNDVEEVITIDGNEFRSVTIHMLKDWNMIAGPSGDVPLNTVDDPDNIIIDNTLYQWDGYYVLVDTIKQGRGYWIRTSDSGIITISLDNSQNISLTKNSVKNNILENCPVITITDVLGRSRKLYLNVKLNNRIDSLKYSLPPIPPSNSFDVRFSNGCYVLPNDEGTISVQTNSFPITVVIKGLKAEEGYQFILKNNEGEEKFVFKENGEFQFEKNSLNSLILAKEKIIPKEFAIYQNFPNPFNPVTTICYDLPEKTKVEIEIYNILGKKVNTLISDFVPAGKYKIKWNGTDSFGIKVSSGIYFYLIKTEKFGSRIKKMIILK